MWCGGEKRMRQWNGDGCRWATGGSGRYLVVVRLGASLSLSGLTRWVDSRERAEKGLLVAPVAPAPAPVGGLPESGSLQRMGDVVSASASRVGKSAASRVFTGWDVGDYRG